MKTAFFVILLVVLSAGNSYALTSESPENFIRRLYKEYLPDYKQNKYWLDNEKKLLKYFDNELTKLFLKNEECKEKTQEMCNLDFDPMVAGQDFDDEAPFNLILERMDGKLSPRIKASFFNMSQRTLIFELRETKRGWRISNIIYADGHSLKEILSQTE